MGPTSSAGFGDPAAIGNLLLEKFLIPFEAASILLLLAAVGAVVLAGHLPGGRALVNIEWYVVLSSLLFAIGAMGILIRRSPVVILLCLELMLNAGNLALVAFSRMVGNQDGQVFAIVVMVVAACEVVVGLGLIVAIFRRRLPLDVDELRELQRMSATAWAWLVLLFPLLGSIVIAARLPGAAGPRRRRDRHRRDRPRLRLRRRGPDRLLGEDPEARHHASSLWDYASAAGLDIKLGIFVDPLSVFMVLVVTGVSTLIHLYSFGYMAVRRGLPPLLQLPQLLRLLDAAAGPRRQLRPPDRRLGLRRLRLLRADQLLVPADDRDRRRG